MVIAGASRNEISLHLRNLHLRPCLRRCVETPQTICAILRRSTTSGRLRCGEVAPFSLTSGRPSSTLHRQRFQGPSIDTLIEMLGHAGADVSVVVTPRSRVA